MQAIPLDTLKHHLNIEAEWTGDDRYLEALERSARAALSAMTNRDLDELTEAEEEIAREALLLLVGEWYMQREDAVVGAAVNRLPNGVEHLVHLLKSYHERR